MTESTHKNKLSFNIIFPPDVKIVSVNSQYEPKRGRGGKILGFYLNPEVAKMMKFIQLYLKKEGYKKGDIKDEWGLLKVEYAFIFKKNIWMRDVDNCVKHVQDAVFRYFNRNDAQIMEFTARKFLNPGVEFESVLCSIEGLGTDSKLYNLDLIAKGV